MKTSVIRYRVADFLRESPPFDVISLEDLLAFSGGGRVVFHEDDIYLFRKGDPRESVLWVVQQGRVELIDESPAGVQLRDVRGPGDILGLGQPGDAVYQLTARTATEVILYGFDLNAFETLAGKYPEAGRFLTAHVSAAARRTKALHAPLIRERLLTEKEKAVWLNATTLPADWLPRRVTTCEAALPVREAVKLMAEAPKGILAVVAAQGNPLGFITDAGIRNQAATGTLTLDAPAEALMNRHFLTAQSGLRPAAYLLQMLRGRGHLLAVTDDGTALSPLRGMMTDTDLEVACGRNPVLLLRELQAAGTVAELAFLWQRVEALTVESLAGPSVVEWLSQMLREFRSVLIERAVVLSEAELARVGRPSPGVACCWLLFGEAGRGEMLTSVLPEMGLVYDDPSPGNAEAVEEYFLTLARKVEAKLKACGLQHKAHGPGVERGRQCRTLSEWKGFFGGQIEDPIGNQIYTGREYFDFSAVWGEPALAAELRQGILEGLEKSDTFLPVLANDTIATLPPLTFYEGSALETDGRLNQTLDVGRTALTPLADAARVLAFARRDVAAASTAERLRRSAEVLPQFASTFTDAAEAWRIVCYHRAAGLSTGAEGAAIHPARLSRFEQRMLKTAFDSTRRFVELASTIYRLGGPQ